MKAPHFEGVPPTIARLPRDENGWPIPYFSATVNGRQTAGVADARKLAPAVRNSLCWICGVRMPDESPLAFITGPNGLRSRQATDWASHSSCALFAVRYCPFMAVENWERSKVFTRAGTVVPIGGTMAKPPVTILITTMRVHVLQFADGILFRFPNAHHAEIYRLGKRIPGGILNLKKGEG
jgi:hypothetical protein